MSQQFDVEAWLKSIDIWDERYDYVTHNDHWLTSKWSADCPKCQAKGTPTKRTVTNNCNLTATKVPSAISNSIDNDPTLKNETHFNLITTQASPLQPVITPAVTPIAPRGMSRAFVTPYTGGAGGLPATFQRNTRQSAKKNQDLIDLNETFDLYRSALADTPVSQQPPTASSKIPKIPVRLSRPLDSHD